MNNLKHLNSYHKIIITAFLIMVLTNILIKNSFIVISGVIITSLIISTMYLLKKDYKRDFQKLRIYNTLINDFAFWFIGDIDKSYFSELTKKRNSFIFNKLSLISVQLLLIVTAITLWFSFGGLSVYFILFGVLILLTFPALIWMINKFKILSVLSIPAISLFYLLVIYSSPITTINKPSFGILLFISINLIIALMLALLINPYEIRKVSSNSFIYEIIINLVIVSLAIYAQRYISQINLLGTSFSKNDQSNIPRWLLETLQNKETIKGINDLIQIMVSDHYTGLFTFYGLIAIISINIINLFFVIKKAKNFKVAEHKYRETIKKIHNNKDISYRSLCEISYYGGNDFDILLISNPKLYEIIQQNELQKRHQLKNHHLKI